MHASNKKMSNRFSIISNVLKSMLRLHGESYLQKRKVKLRKGALRKMYYFTMLMDYLTDHCRERCRERCLYRCLNR